MKFVLIYVDVGITKFLPVYMYVIQLMTYLLKISYQITMPANTVNITATTGVAAAMGFYYYLKTYCGCQITWGGQQLALPAILPNISSTGITITTNDK